jgi:hypothetical protein
MTTYRTFYAEAEIDVDLNEWDDDELIKELESREYQITPSGGHPQYEEMKDDIFALYKEWMDDQGDRDNRFEKAMRKFFEKHLDKVSA